MRKSKIPDNVFVCSILKQVKWLSDAMLSIHRNEPVDITDHIIK